VSVALPPPADTPIRKPGWWESVQATVRPKWLLNKLAGVALEGADIILESIPGAGPIKELKEARWPLRRSFRDRRTIRIDHVKPQGSFYWASATRGRNVFDNHLPWRATPGRQAAFLVLPVSSQWPLIPASALSCAAAAHSVRDKLRIDPGWSEGADSHPGLSPSG
jgi:hypothetical protein